MELLRVLGALAEPPGPEHHGLAAAAGLPDTPGSADHTALFVLQLPPFASIYLGAEGMMGGAARDRIAGFWRALGLVPRAEPDHLTTTLAFHAGLIERETEEGGAGAERWRRARHAFFWEHLASWIFTYMARLDEIASPFYRSWSEMLREVLSVEAGTLGPPIRLPLHLRQAPPALRHDAERSSALALDDIVAHLLTPVRSGIILTRSDLVRCGEEAGIVIRLTDRRAALRALLQQAPDASFHWLRHEALWQAERYRAWPATAAEIIYFWEERALSSAAALEYWKDTAAPSAGHAPEELSHA